MNKYSFTLKNGTLERISKAQAKKMYNLGLNVLFCPVNMSPIARHNGLMIWQNKDLEGQYDDFEKLCNAYSYYNCVNETGRYIAYYAPFAYYDRFSGEVVTEHYTNAIKGYYHEYFSAEG